MSCLSQTPPLGGLSPPQGVLQGHAAHLAEWSAKLRPQGSWGTCIPQGVITFFHTAFTAHSDAGAEAIGRRLQALVRLRIGRCTACPFFATSDTLLDHAICLQEQRRSNHEAQGLGRLE